jgi:hypothetical protein
VEEAAHCIQCICDSKDLYLMLETTNAITIKWWIDTSFTMHLDMKSHTGGTVSLGEGSVYFLLCQSSVSTQKAQWKQNLSESMTVCHW